MGTTSSTEESNIINLSRRSKIQAMVSASRKPSLHFEHLTSGRSLGVILLCDTEHLTFNSPKICRLCDALSSYDFTVMSLNLTRTEDGEYSTAIPEITDAAHELLESGGCDKVALLGFGCGAELALQFSTSGSLFAAVAVCYPNIGAGILRICESPEAVMLPTLLVTAAVDDKFPEDNAQNLVAALRAARPPTRIRMYKDQQRGFVDREQTSVSMAGIIDIVMWFREHLGAKARHELWRMENIISSPPSDAEWWSEDRSYTSAGVNIWNRQRSSWRTYPSQTRPSPPKSPTYESIVKGFASPQRAYELPGRTSLPSMVSLLNKVWDTEGVC